MPDHQAILDALPLAMIDLAIAGRGDLLDSLVQVAGDPQRLAALLGSVKLSFDPGEARDVTGKWTTGAPGERANAVHATFQQAQKDRRAAFTAVKSDRNAALQRAEALAVPLQQAVDSLSHLDEDDTAFADLETWQRQYHSHDADEGATPAERFDVLRGITEAATAALARMEKPAQELSPEEVESNKATLKLILHHAKQARDELRTAAKHHKEAKAIRGGEGISLSFADGWNDDSAWPSEAALLPENQPAEPVTLV